MSGGGGGGEGGGVLNLSNVEEGRGTEQPESATRREPIANEVVAAGTRVLGACMFGLPWRRIVASLAYMTTMLCVISLVASGALDWAFIGWGVFGSVLFFGCCWFARLIHTYTTAGNARRRGRQRIPRGALEARLQLHHPGIELGRLRLLLVDRDFTGEDYQALLDLDENNDVPSTAGASEGEIRRNPSFLISEPSPDSVVKPKNCSICLYPFKAKERVRIIPCLHQFHTDCIDPWLRQNAICPVCKFPAVG